MAKILLNVEVNKADLKQVEQQLSKALNASSSTGGKSGGGTKSATVNVDNLRKSYANLLTTIQGAEKYFKKGTFSGISTSAKKLQADLIALKSTQGNYTTEVQRLQAELERLQRKFAETRAGAKNTHGTFLEVVKGFAKFQLSAMVVMKPLQMIRNAWGSLNETLVETEDAVVALRRVAGDAANANELYDLAQRYGQTFENVSELATNFARAGYDWNETIKATEAALLALNTAELEATEASDGMIAILQQFGYEASQLESIIDKLNITADNAAVSTDGLLKALTRTGSSAKNARLSLEETVAVITALSEATGRSGENLGTAINSLIQFSTKSSALDTFSKLGGDVEKTVELYRQGGATVLDIWRELSEVIANSQTAESVLGENFTTEEFEALNEELKQSLGENFAQTTEIYDTASTFRKNYFIALLQNLDQVQESLDTMQDAQGYSQKENAQYLDTYTAKVNALEAKWQDIANDEQGLLGIKKTLVGFASDILDIIKKIGGLKGVAQTIVAVLSPFLVNWATTFAANKILSATNAIKVLFSTAATGAQKMNAALGGIGIALGIATTIYNAVKENETSDLEDITTANTNLSRLEQNLSNITNEYENFEDKIKQYRSTLSESTSTEEERGEALKSLNEIQNTLKDTTNEYANSLDLVNGKIDDQIQKIQQLGFIERQKALQEFRDLNIDAIYAAEEYLTETDKTISFSNQNKGFWGALFNEGDFERWLGENIPTEYSSGYNTGGAWNTLKGMFGANTAKLQVTTEGLTKEEQVAFLEELFVKASDIPEREKREKFQAIIRSTIKNITEDKTFQSSKNLIYGNDKGTTLFEKLSQEQRNALLETSTQGQWDNLLREWGFIEGNVNAGGGGSTETTNLSDVVNKLEQIRENTEKTKELEEKALALQEARNQRTVRVFNAETGQWEMQANENAIAEAEKSALDSITDYLATDEAQKKLDEGAFTLPDWLLDKISQPTTDDQFNAFMNLMGIMSGAVNKTPTLSGAVYNNLSNNTTNNNQSYSLNGIPIPANEAGRYFTPEALELLNQMGD